MKAENKGMMVRGVVAIGTRYTGCLSTDVADCEKQGNGYSATRWHRHDDLEGVERELNTLINAWREIMHYSNVYDSMGYTFEYKPYKE